MTISETFVNDLIHSFCDYSDRNFELGEEHIETRMAYSCVFGFIRSALSGKLITQDHFDKLFKLMERICEFNQKYNGFSFGFTPFQVRREVEKIFQLN